MDEEKVIVEHLADIPLVTWLLVAFFSGWGGTVAYIQKLKAGHIERVSIMEFIGEIITAAFSGTMTYVAGRAIGVPELFLVPLVGVAGHMGSKLILIGEKLLQERMTRLAERYGWVPPKDKGDGND